MRNKIAAVLVGALLATLSVSPALASTTGYEGQPGNQSGSTGQNGYEGQPGNQGGGHGHHGYEGQPGNQSHR